MASSPSSTVSLAPGLTGPANMSLGSKKFIGAVKDEWQLYSDRASDYTIGSAIGFGASSIVYAATYQPQPPTPPPISCALKVLDLDALPPRSLALLQQETTLMSLSKHPNVLRVRGSWMNGHKLYIALRLMNKGSAADVMRYGWPGGMEEDVIRCILCQALQGLNYLHINGFIHRDIKAANLLIDDDGTVLLGDLGVAANLAEDTSQLHGTSISRPESSAQQTDNGHGNLAAKRVVLFDHTVPVVERPRMGKRKSFVGTPWWMAPELIQGRQYDSSADIWSFGITALELTQGRPPRSRESPQRVLLRTIRDEPPTLDRVGGVYKYSRAFKEMVDSCLVKDPSKRPTAQELLQTPFFKASKKKSYLVGAILKDLPPLSERQERRLAHHAQTLHSIDSWDFTTTLNSSAFYAQTMEGVGSPSQVENTEPGDGVFEIEDNPVLEDQSHKRRHIKGVSWANEPEITSEQGFTDPGPSPSTSPTDDSSTSSSLRDSTPISRPQSPNRLIPVAPLPQNALTHKRNLSDVNLPSLRVFTSTSKSSLDGHGLSSSSQVGLWQRFKSNVRRRDGLNMRRQA